MEFVGIRSGANFDVLLVMDVGGPCPTLSIVKALSPAHAELYEEVRRALYEVLPAHGPDAWEWKQLRGETREYVFGGLPDAAFRIVWFLLRFV